MFAFRLSTVPHLGVLCTFGDVYVVILLKPGWKLSESVAGIFTARDGLTGFTLLGLVGRPRGLCPPVSAQTALERWDSPSVGSGCSRISCFCLLQTGPSRGHPTSSSSEPRLLTPAPGSPLGSACAALTDLLHSGIMRFPA